MNIVLIDIGYKHAELNEPLGIEVLTAAINHEFPQCSIFTFCQNLDESISAEQLCRCLPAVIGISTKIGEKNRMDAVLSAIEKAFPDNDGYTPLIVIGDIYATYAFEQVLTIHPNYICVIGEGEDAWLAIVGAYIKNNTFLQFHNLLESDLIPNIAYNHNGIKLTHRKVRNLNDKNYSCQHPYARKTIEQNGIIRIEASRGCPWNSCSFCVLQWKYAGIGWRPLDINIVINEIVSLSQVGAKTIFFTDEEFIGNDFERIINLCNQIDSLKHEGIMNPCIEFVASTSVKALTSQYDKSLDILSELLEALKKAGFRSFFLGVESGSDSQLRRFCKGVTSQENHHILRLLAEWGFEVDIGYILFDPETTLAELDENLEFIQNNDLIGHMSRFAKRLRIVPFTPIAVNYLGNDFDFNMTEYQYHFRDIQTAMVYDEYSRWEKQNLEYAHKIQGRIREAPDGVKRHADIVELSRLRIEELHMLKKIVDKVKESE